MVAMVRADERLKKEFPLITLPVLILHGTADKNTRPSGSQHFYEMAGSTDKTLKLYEDSFHDLLNDVDKDLVILDIKSWINGHLPAAAGRPRLDDSSFNMSTRRDFIVTTIAAAAASLRLCPFFAFLCQGGPCILRSVPESIQATS